jgi:hypothetical protein
MADDAGVMDAGLDLDIGSTESPTTETATETPDPQETANKFSKEYRDWVRSIRDTQAKDNPNVLKYAKTAYDSYGRIEALRQLDPKGLDGVRETYSLIQAAGGPQAITEMQQRLSEQEAQNALIASGDPKAFDAMGEDFNEGLAKLAPHYLDRLMKISPEAYSNALLPHLMTSLTRSELVPVLDAMIDDIQNGGYDDKAKLARLSQHLTRASQWFNQQQQRAGQLKQAPTVDPNVDKFQQERSEFEKQKTEHFWSTQVTPDVVKFENDTLEKLFKPYQDRLKLNEVAKKALFSDFKRGLSEAGQKDEQYKKQMGMYRAHKSPNPADIKTFVQNNINKYAKQVVDSTVSSRYGNFLNARPGPRPGTPRAAAANGASPVTVVMSKPSTNDIDWNATKRANDGRDIYQHIYTLKNGKRVQVKKS